MTQDLQRRRGVNAGNPNPVPRQVNKRFAPAVRELNGPPVGMSLIGARGTDPALLECAAALADPQLS